MTPDVHLQRNQGKENCFGMSFANLVATYISCNTHQEE